MVSQIDYLYIPESMILRETLEKRARGQKLTWPEISNYYHARANYYYKLSSKKKGDEIDKYLDKAEKYEGKLIRFLRRIKGRFSKITKKSE